MDQLSWDLKYGVTSDCISLEFQHAPCPPGQGTLNTVISNTRYATTMEYNARPEPIPRTVHALHEPVLVNPQAGSIMDPMRGVDPSIASSQQAYEHGHIVERVGERELRAGLEVASCEETAGEPKPRMPFPKDLSGYTRERGIAMSDLNERISRNYRAFHFNPVPCLVWECGRGLMASLSYEEAPVWAQGKQGTPVTMPVEGTALRYAFTDCRELFAQIQMKCQKKVLVLSPPGMFWRMAKPAAVDDAREHVRHIANSN